MNDIVEWTELIVLIAVIDNLNRLVLFTATTTTTTNGSEVPLLHSQTYSFISCAHTFVTSILIKLYYYRLLSFSSSSLLFLTRRRWCIITPIMVYGSVHHWS